MNSILDHISHSALDDAIEEHYKEIMFPSTWKVYIIDNLFEMYDSAGLTAIQKEVIAYILQNFEKLIKGTPSDLEIHMNKIEQDFNFSDLIKGKSNSFKKALIKAFSYSTFRKEMPSRKLTQALDLKSCPYCNAQYTLATKVRNSKGQLKLLFEIDHFYPKSKYPYLSLSFYNLIPSCSSCNRSKSSKPSFLSNNFHPYSNDSVGHHFEFHTDPLDIAKLYINGNNHFKIHTRITVPDPLKEKVQRHLDDYSISELYARHNDIVEELAWKKYIYTYRYKKNLIEKYFEGLFKDSADLERFIIGNYSKKPDMLRRPLSKFASDIAKDLDLIKK